MYILYLDLSTFGFDQQRLDGCESLILSRTKRVTNEGVHGEFNLMILMCLKDYFFIRQKYIGNTERRRVGWICVDDDLFVACSMKNICASRKSASW